METTGRLMHQAYQLDSSDVLRTLGTSGQGLSLSAVQIRLAEHGPNLLAEEAPVSRWMLLLHQFVNPLVYILLITAAVTAFLGEYKDTVVILVAVAIRTGKIGVRSWKISFLYFKTRITISVFSVALHKTGR